MARMISRIRIGIETGTQAVIVASLLAVTTAACNTVEGFGRDVQSVGEEVDEKT